MFKNQMLQKVHIASVCSSWYAVQFQGHKFKN